MISPPAVPGRSPHALRHVFVALALVLAPAIAHATEWNIDQLMRGLAQVRSDHARFVEKKFIAMLDKPVESSGELFYTAPDYLEKRTIKPKPESMILDHGKLLIERGRQSHELQLADYPELAAFIDSIRATLAGDRKALERDYRLRLDGTAEHWTLQLLPLDERVQAVVKRILITGVRDAVRGLEIFQADGDSSIMLIEMLPTP